MGGRAPAAAATGGGRCPLCNAARARAASGQRHSRENTCRWDGVSVGRAKALGSRAARRHEGAALTRARERCKLRGGLRRHRPQATHLYKCFESSPANQQGTADSIPHLCKSECATLTHCAKEWASALLRYRKPQAAPQGLSASVWNVGTRASRTGTF